jgi:hypothetical protein
MASHSSTSPEDQELFSRAATRTAYYGCFHKALEWANLRGYAKPHGWSFHEALWECWYGSDPATEPLRIAGQALHAKRVAADYRIDEVFHYKPDDIMEEAEELMQLIDDDMTRVAALGISHLNIQWDPRKHPRRRKAKKSKASP